MSEKLNKELVSYYIKIFKGYAKIIKMENLSINNGMKII